MPRQGANVSTGSGGAESATLPRGPSAENTRAYLAQGACRIVVYETCEDDHL